MYGFAWEDDLLKLFGSKTAVFLTEKLIRSMADVDSESISNVRFAQVGDSYQEDRYAFKKRSSDVPKDTSRFDTIVFHRFTGKEYKIGFDYVRPSKN